MLAERFRRCYLSNLKKIELPPQGLKTLFGVQDQNIKYLETLLDVRIGARGNELLIDGDPKDIKPSKTFSKISPSFSTKAALFPTKNCATPSNKSPKTVLIQLKRLFHARAL
jgi:hypothetical protein